MHAAEMSDSWQNAANSSAETGNDQRHLRLVTQQSSEFVVEAERGVDHIGHGLVHRIRNGPGDVVGHRPAGISGSLISRIIIRVGIGLR